MTAESEIVDINPFFNKDYHDGIDYAINCSGDHAIQAFMQRIFTVWDQPDKICAAKQRIDQMQEQVASHE